MKLTSQLLLKPIDILKSRNAIHIDKTESMGKPGSLDNLFFYRYRISPS